MKLSLRTSGGFVTELYCWNVLLLWKLGWKNITSEKGYNHRPVTQTGGEKGYHCRLVAGTGVITHFHRWSLIQTGSDNPFLSNLSPIKLDLGWALVSSLKKYRPDHLIRVKRTRQDFVTPPHFFSDIESVVGATEEVWMARRRTWFGCAARLITRRRPDGRRRGSKGTVRRRKSPGRER